MVATLARVTDPLIPTPSPFTVFSKVNVVAVTPVMTHLPL